MKLAFNEVKSSNLNETEKLTIGDPRVIVQILTEKLYSQPVKTSIKEYITNALEASDKVDITLPTKLNNYTMSIRDYGPGLSPEEMRDIFMSLGTSTKRDTDDFVGGFGIGSKSAFSFTKAFQITSINNNHKRNYICQIKDGSISLSLVSSAESDEPTGIEIKLPIPNDKVFFINNYMNELLSGFDISKLPNIKPIVDIHLCKWTEVEPGIEYTRDVIARGKVFIGSGGVYFPFPTPDRKRLAQNIGLRIQTGTVDIAPNRETIAMNDYLERAYAKVGKKIEHLFLKDVRKLLSSPDFIYHIPKIAEILENTPSWMLPDIKVDNPLFDKPLFLDGSGTLSFSGDFWQAISIMGYHATPKAEFQRRHRIRLKHMYGKKDCKFFTFDTERPSAIMGYRAHENNKDYKLCCIRYDDVYWQKFIKHYKLENLKKYKKKPVRKPKIKASDLEVRYMSYISLNPSTNVYVHLDKFKGNHYVAWIPFSERSSIQYKYGIPTGSYGLTILMPTKKEEKLVASMFPHVSEIKFLANALKNYQIRAKKAHNVNYDLQHRLEVNLHYNYHGLMKFVEALCPGLHKIEMNGALRLYKKALPDKSKFRYIYEYLMQDDMFRMMYRGVNNVEDAKKVMALLDYIDWEEAFDDIIRPLSWRLEKHGR